MASIAITEATPKMMPSMVRSDRVVLDRMASAAIRKLYISF